MSLALDEFRATLIREILRASSQEEVTTCIETAMAEIEKKQVNGHIVVRFVDKINGQLDLFSPLKKDAQEWSNINMARILFTRIKNQLVTPAK